VISLKPKPRSLKRRLLDATIRSAVAVACFGAAFSMAPSASVTTSIPDREDSPSYAESLADAHGCWTGEAPANVGVPGHVIATHPAHPSAPAYYGSHVVGLALEQIFDGKDHGLTVYAFCR
jgi:hypothetical protein